MPSRINIGPEDGPYVAINESSGNLQLEDNSGNVVAEWDETNAQWDFANNTLNNVDALNSNSVNTEGLDSKTIRGLADFVVQEGQTIRDAVDEVDAGATIYVPRGVFDTGSSPFRQKNNLTFIGESRYSTIIEGDNGQSNLAIRDPEGQAFERLTLRATDSGEVASAVQARVDDLILSNCIVESPNADDVNDAVVDIRNERITLDVVDVTTAAPDPSEGIRLTPGSEDCSVVNCRVDQSIDDAGTNNNIPANGQGNVIIS